uniref:Uncharacterized protein n=1 Tax=Panagrolaimus sp. ES5 TaxID=591445 RepID=A0AC34FYK2_9BILA
MDSSVNHQVATTASSNPSNREVKAVDSKNVVSSKKIFFTGPYRQQDWSLPDSLMYYMAMNPKSAETYQKLVKSCKYFYIKNPILVAPQLQLVYYDKKWHIFSRKETIEMVNVTQKLWIIDFFDVTINAGENVAASVISNIYKCDAKSVYLQNQTISFNDFCFLALNVEEKLLLENTFVKNPDGSILAFQKLFQIITKVQSISFKCHNTIGSTISSETFNELLKCPHFPKLKFFSFSHIPEAFDLDSFYGYMKKNKFTEFELCFDDSISDAYKNRLVEIIDEILANEERDYKTPFINFPGIDFEKYLKLYRICYHY